MLDLALQRLARRTTPLLTLALLGAGCCLSVGPEGIAGAKSSGQGSAGQGTSGQGTSGQGSGGQTSNGGSATAGACSGLMVIPDTLDFDSTVINTVAKRTVMLENCSTASVTGITASLIGGDANLFVVDDAPAVLEPGASVTVDISYSPLALETRSLADVIFRGSDGENATLALFGEPTGVALTIEPNPCNFGFVDLTTTAVCCSTVTNQSNVTIHINGVTNFAKDGAFAVATTDNSVPPNPQAFPITIPGGGSANVCFSFTPPITQEYSGQVTLVTDDPTGTNPVIELSGWGGGPQISCTPLTVAFGATPDHTVATVPIICTNVGTAIPSTNLVIEPPTASPGVFTAEFDEDSDLYPLNGLAPGESAQIDVSYAPTSTSNDMGTLFIKNNGGVGQTLQIPLTGQGLNVPPCRFEIAPSSINFGNQQVGDSTTLAFDVTNVGSAICLVDGPRVGNDAAGAFRIVSTSAQPDPTTGKITIPASSSLTVQIAFSPTLTGAFSAEILFSISDPSDPNQAVELTGTSEETCLQIAPTSLAFGTSGMDDAGVFFTSQSQSFAVSNQCQTSATIDAIASQNGPGDLVSQYSLPAGPSLPDSLAAGAQATYDLDCQPTSSGYHPGQVLISDGTVDVLLPMTCSVP